MATVIKIYAPKFMVVAVISNLRSGRVNIERFGSMVKWAVRIAQIVNTLYEDCDGLALKFEISFNMLFISAFSESHYLIPFELYFRMQIIDVGRNFSFESKKNRKHCFSDRILRL